MIEEQNINSKNLNKKLKQAEITINGYKEEKENFNKKTEDIKIKYDKEKEELNNEIKQIKGNKLVFIVKLFY